MDDRDIDAELRLDSKLFSAVAVDNASNLAHLNKKTKKKYANTFDPERELHPDNTDFLQQVQRYCYYKYKIIVSQIKLHPTE